MPSVHSTLDLKEGFLPSLNDVKHKLMAGFPDPPQYADGIEFLIHSYPKFVAVENVPCDSTEEKVRCSDACV